MRQFGPPIGSPFRTRAVAGTMAGTTPEPETWRINLMETAVSALPPAHPGARPTTHDATPAGTPATTSTTTAAFTSAPARAVLRKTPPQGLRLRRFKRPSPRAASPIAPVDLRHPLTLRKPALR